MPILNSNLSVMFGNLFQSAIATSQKIQDTIVERASVPLLNLTMGQMAKRVKMSVADLSNMRQAFAAAQQLGIPNEALSAAEYAKSVGAKFDLKPMKFGSHLISGGAPYYLPIGLVDYVGERNFQSIIRGAKRTKSPELAEELLRAGERGRTIYLPTEDDPILASMPKKSIYGFKDNKLLNAYAALHEAGHAVDLDEALTKQPKGFFGAMAFNSNLSKGESGRKTRALFNIGNLKHGQIVPPANFREEDVEKLVHLIRNERVADNFARKHFTGWAKSTGRKIKVPWDPSSPEINIDGPEYDGAKNVMNQLLNALRR